jgi:hypothetical protein
MQRTSLARVPRVAAACALLALGGCVLGGDYPNFRPGDLDRQGGWHTVGPEPWTQDGSPGGGHNAGGR